MAFPENPPAEWFAVDLLEHADQAATSHVEVADVRALRELRPVPEGAVDPRLHDAINLLDEFRDNRAKSVRCVHPLVTLPEKLDALHRGFPNDKVVPAAFVRHYEDAARLIEGRTRDDRLDVLGPAPLRRRRDRDNPRVDHRRTRLSGQLQPTSVLRAGRRNTVTHSFRCFVLCSDKNDAMLR